MEKAAAKVAKAVMDNMMMTMEPSEVDYDEGSTFDLERRKEKTVPKVRPSKKPGAKATPKAKAAAASSARARSRSIALGQPALPMPHLH